MSSWLNSNVDFGYTATASLVCHNQGKAAQLYLPLSEYELWLTFCTLLKVCNSVSTAEPTVNHAKTLPPLPCAPHDSCVLHASILLALLLSRLPVPLLPSSPWSRQQDLCWSSLLSWSYDQEYYKYQTIKLTQQKPIQNHKIVRRNWARVLFCFQTTATSCPHSPATGSLKTCSTAPRRTRNSSKRCRFWLWSPTGWLEAPSLPGTRSSSPVDHSSFTTAAPSMDLVPQISKVLLIVTKSDCEWPGSLYEQAGPAEVSILPDNPWDGCGDKKR